MAYSSSTVNPRGSPPYPPGHFIENQGARFDGRRVAPMCLTVDTKPIGDVHTTRMHDAAGVAWTKRR